MDPKRPMWPLYPHTHCVRHAWNTASLLPSPDIQHITHPGRHLGIGIHLCMLTFIRSRKFRVVVPKKSLPGHRTNFQKSIDQNQSFFPGLT